MKKIIKNTLAMLFATVALTSCLKDDSTVLDPDKAGANVLEFANPAEIAVHGSTTPLYVLSYPIKNTPTAIPISVTYAGAEDAAPQDITVSISVGGQPVIDQYNTEQGKSFLIMPSSWYTLSATSVVIPKGQKSASITVNVNTSQIILTSSYVLPLKLTSSNATVSANFSNILLNIGAKNAYDGLYKYTTTATTSLQPNLNKSNIALTTTGPNSVKVSPGLLATYSNAVSYTIDPTTFKVEVTAALGLGAVTPGDPRSNWNPATKTLTVFWAQQNSPRIFEEKFVYTGVR